MEFSFKLQTKMLSGAGVCRGLPGVLKSSGSRAIGLIIDAGVAECGYYKEIEQLLSDASLVGFRFISSYAEPSFDEVDSVAAEFRRQKLDALLAVGGGSVLDLAKGVSVLMTNPGPAIQYRGYGLIKNSGIPLYVVPTTAGSGSEVTPNASYVDTTARRKLGINSELYLPKLAILDPEFLISCPRSVAISAGLDALVHALESFTARSTTPIAKMFAKEAFLRIFNFLPRVLEEPTQVEWWGELQLGAYYAAIALINSASGVAGVLSYPLGVHFKVPHGFAGAVFLSPVARFNVEHGYYGYAELYDLIAGADTSLSVSGKSLLFCQEIDRLCQKCDIPSSLSKFGVEEKDISRLAVEAYANRTKSAEQNPISTGAPELEAIMRMVI